MFAKTLSDAKTRYEKLILKQRKKNKSRKCPLLAEDFVRGAKASLF